MIVRTAPEVEVSGGSTTSISGPCSGPQTDPAILKYQPAEMVCDRLSVLTVLLKKYYVYTLIIYFKVCALFTHIFVCAEHVRN